MLVQIPSSQNIPRKSNQWNGVYKLFYDALHELAEAFLHFDKVKIVNHRCLLAYFCEKNNEYSWEFFEKIRTKRNGIHYYGKPVRFEDWKEVEYQLANYIDSIKKEIGRKFP